MGALVSLVLIGLFLTGCGYRPVTTYTKKVLTDKIYTEIEINMRDPENAVLVKDAVNEAIVSRFGATVASREAATTQLYVQFENVRFRPIQFDRNGYAIYYRATVRLKISYNSRDGKTGREKVIGYYDFPIEPTAIISDTMRFNAIKGGSAKAIDAFISKIAAKGVRL